VYLRAEKQEHENGCSYDAQLPDHPKVDEVVVYGLLLAIATSTGAWAAHEVPHDRYGNRSRFRRTLAFTLGAVCWPLVMPTLAVASLQHWMARP
jgi:hypothetical protein